MKLKFGMSGIAAMAGLLVAAAGVSVAGAAPAAAATCAGVGSDYNGDGLIDNVVTDPQASVNGVQEAGLVRVIYAGGAGVAEISQATPGMGAVVPERGDRFGSAIAWTDFNGDGCTDLAVGTPNEDTGTDGTAIKDAGIVHIIYGSPSGLGAGPATHLYGQESFGSGTNEAGDLFGYALQAGTADSGKPFLVIGAPGEGVFVDGVNKANAGAITYMQGDTRGLITQDSPGVPGIAEAGDQFGAALAATNRYFAVGEPGETIGDEAVAAGGVAVFNHTLADGLPTPLVGLDQAGEGEGLAGIAEAGDRFGTALSMTNYRPASATYNTDALLAIGTPGEAVGSVQAAGCAVVVRIEPSGKFTQVTALDAAVANVEGDPAAGDSFGQRVAITNTNTEVVTTTSTTRLAVGVPGRDVDGVADAGVVHIFKPLDSDAGSADKIIKRGSGVLPGTPNARDFTGIALRSGTTLLYIGVPYSKDPATSKGVLYTMPWTDIDGTTNVGTKTFQPGVSGLSDIGTAFATVG
ncbi:MULTISPECIES: FG-GAP repeat protein [unclassified Streptomyces]|uniref:FG-GAP repeat protein n=1 Tax=unclassified Streptomyces TaxID=2593676 RepID=UPI003822D61B